MFIKFIFIGLLIVLAIYPQSCEIHTQLFVKGGNPPEFVMTGNGIFTALRVWGPKQQRKIEGPDASAYWYIRAEKGGAISVDEIDGITYGMIPEGYKQVYPERDEAPPLIEGEKYHIRVETTNANGDEKFFLIRNGQVKFAKYGYQLDEN